MIEAPRSAVSPPLGEALDAALDGPVLLESGDLTGGSAALLVPEERLQLVEDVLRAEGFHRRGTTWARFLPGTAERITVTTPAARGLRDAEALLDGARPLDGIRHVVLPSASVAGLLGTASSTRGSERRRRRALPVRVSLSGPDGSGKSTQLAALRTNLEAVGVPVDVAWSPTVTRKRFVTASVAKGDAGRTAPRAALVARARRWLRRPAEHGWITAIALRNAGEMWRNVLGRDPRRVLLLDRFSLDALVKLEYWYGERRRVPIGFERRLFRLVAPRAHVAVLLVVPPAFNRARRPEDWSEAELEVFWRLYREAAARVGACLVDASRTVEAVAADVATAVWTRLP